MSSPALPAVGGGGSTTQPRTLRSTKAILRTLRERGLLVAKSTLWGWRKHLPPAQRPPIRIRIDGMRPTVTADRKELQAWVDRMERKGLFSRSVKVRETRARRRAAVAPPPNPARI